jgi:hypothetical protein
MLTGLASCIIACVSFFGCGVQEDVWKIKGYYAIGAVFPLFFGVLLASICARSEPERAERWRKRCTDGLV